MRRILRTAVLAATFLFAATMAAPAAQASVNPYSPSVLCGLGYQVKVVEDVVRWNDPVPAAELYLLHNPTTNLFCAVTIKQLWVGVPTETSVGVIGGTGQDLHDSGWHYYYAGPVWQVPGFGQPNCIGYGASLTDPYGNIYYHESANPAIGYGVYCL